MNDAYNAFDVTVDIFAHAFLYYTHLVLYEKIQLFFQDIQHALFQDASRFVLSAVRIFVQTEYRGLSSPSATLSYLFTYSMVQDIIWKANSHSVC
jgi:hypothetical protein